MESATRNRSTSSANSTSSSRQWALPQKATLSPAEVFDHTALPQTEAVPRDYSESSTRSTGSSGAVSTTMTTNDELLSLASHRRLSRVSEILQKTIDSPPRSPRSLSNFAIAESPYSSTDSLASLVERQQKNKIIHPSHETALFGFNSGRRATHSAVETTRRGSTASLLAVLQGQTTKKRVSDSIPSVKSPLHSSIDATIDSNTGTTSTTATTTTTTIGSHESRRLHPPPNPHHVHSSPSVKESKTVSLGYDPVSRKKMLNSYEIIKEIGRGEHGKVKLAKHLETDELVAIKIVDRKGPRKSFRPGSSHEEKIRREIAIMKKINHPNVVQLKEVMDDANSRKIYLVLEYLEKGEVKWQKAKFVPMMTLQESMMVFRDVVLGLEYLHYQGIVHRDIKPANLLIAGDGSVKISDFGVSFASSLKSGEQDDYDLAKTAGTPAFLAPELCRPLDDDEEQEHPKITYKIDIWALGVTLYCFLFGKLPFWATNEFELFDVIHTKELTFPETFPDEFTEEDKQNALDLLKKVLDKNPKKRLTIQEIKRHPLTLRDLSPEEAQAFTEEQKSCVCKIAVSNEEVQVAVTGLGSKLRKGFAKALKFAFSGKKLPHTEPATPSAVATSTADSGEDPILCDAISCHRRVKSGDISCETHANVEGDLFLNNSSALNSLNNIFNDDKRRSSVSLSMQTSTGGRSSTAVSEAMSNESSLSRGTQLVSLPVNASFASLDSVYLDSYAPTYAYTSVADARGPPSVPTITTSPPAEPTTAHGREVFSKMSQFEMNKSTEKKDDDAVAPNHVQPTFCLNGDSDDEDDHEREDDYDHYDYDEGEHNDMLSELSVPSYLVQDLGGNAASDIDENSRRGSRMSNGPTRGGKPKYSFFENSDSDSDEIHSGPEVIFAESSEEEEEDDDEDEGITRATIFDHHHLSLQRHRSAEPFGMMPRHDEEEEEEDSSDGELTLSFGGKMSQSRERCSSLSADSSYSDSYGRKHPLQRVSSPLSHNAPKTPIATSNAHSNPHPLSHEQYTNHYHKVHGYHGHKGGSTTENGRGRSNSITVGLLKSPSIEGGMN